MHRNNLRTIAIAAAFAMASQAPALGAKRVENKTPDTRPPEIIVATVDGSTLSVLFDDDLDPGQLPDKSAFTVKVTPDGGTESTVDLANADAVQIGGAYLVLNLASSVVDRDDVTVSYAVPATNALRDDAHNDAEAFTDEPVRNDTDDTSPPILSQATVAGTTLKLVYDEDLDPDSVPASTAFTVEVTPEGESKETRTLADTTPVAIDGETVRLTLATAVVGTDEVVISYTKPTGSSAMPLQDEAENAVANLSAEDVENASDDTTAPAYVDSVVNGDTLTLNFNEDLDTGSVPDADAFTVTVTPAGGTAATRALADTDPVTVSGSTVVLILASAVIDTDTVTVAYAVPTGSGAMPIRDPAENNAAAVPTDTATNESEDMTPPTLTGGEVNASTITLTFDEALDTSSVPPASAFTVNKGEETLELSGSPSISGAKVTLALTAAVVAQDTVTVSYAKPTSGSDNELQDTDGNEVENFADRPVDNATPRPLLIGSFQRIRLTDASVIDDPPPVRVRFGLQINFNTAPMGFDQGDLEVTNGMIDGFVERNSRTYLLTIDVDDGATSVTRNAGTGEERGTNAIEFRTEVRW